MGFDIIFILCISFIHCDSYQSTITVRCDDYCRKISHNGVALPPDSYDTNLHYNFQTITLNLRFGNKIEFYIQNENAGDMGVYANIPLYQLNFGTIDTRYWKGIKIDPISKTTDSTMSSYNFIKSLPAGETDTMTVTIPEYITSMDYYLYSIKGNSNTFVIQPMNYISVSLEGDYELYITFLTLPDKGLLKYVNHSNGQISAITTNTSYSFMQNNILFEYTDSIINTYTNAHYYISNSTSRLSNEGTMTIVICNYEGTEKCEYKANFYDSNIYYESCNEGYHFYLFEHNYCIPDEKKNNTYLDNTEDPPIYKTCTTRCSSCDIDRELYFDNCNECSNLYFPLEALPINCVQQSEVDSSFSKVNGKYQSTNEYVYQDTSGVYHSTNDCWYSSSPFIYSGLKFCVDDCSMSKRNAHNGVCINKCPYNYVSISSVCVEKSMTEPTENGYHITNESKEYLIDNMRYNVMLYNQIGSNFKGEDFIMQVYSTNNQPIYSKNISHINFDSLFEGATRRLSLTQSTADILIVKMDIERDQSVSNQVEYSLYSKSSSSPLYYRIDLSSLEGTTLDISYPITKPLSFNTTLASQLSESGYDILNSSSSFYTDSCYPFSIGSSDIIVRDRQDYIYKDIELCEEGCTYKFIDYTTDNVVCSCPVKMSMSYTKTKPIRISNTMERKNTSDYEFFFCFKTFFKLSTIKNNYGFLSYISILLIESIVIIMFFFESHRLIEKIATEVNRTATQTEEIKKVSNIYILVKTKKDKRFSQKLTDNSCRGLIVSTTTTKQDESIKETPKEEVKEQDDSVDIKSLSDNPGLIFCYIMKRKVSLINILSSSQKYSMITMKISIYLFRIAVNCFLNALLYNEKIISEKFHNNGKESVLTILTIVLCSNVMSHFFVIGLNMFFSVDKFLFVFNEQIAMLNPSFMKHQASISSYITTKFVFISILMILSLIFFLYYITLYCYIYSHSQTQWLINCAFSASFSFGYTVCISIFFTMLFSITNMRNSSSVNPLLIFIFWVL